MNEQRAATPSTEDLPEDAQEVIRELRERRVAYPPAWQAGGGSTWVLRFTNGFHVNLRPEDEGFYMNSGAFHVGQADVIFPPEGFARLCAPGEVAELIRRVAGWKAHTWAQLFPLTPPAA